MGLLVDGQWHDKWYDTKTSGGRFVRSDSQFRNWVTADGSAGPSGEGGFQAEAGRYHLYVSLACPWAHRTLIFRALKGLEDAISVTAVDPLMLENGWEFGKEPDGAPFHGPDPLFGKSYLHQIYTQAMPDYSGRVTVPVLWDKERGTIVSNESSEIIRMLNSAFDAFATKPLPDLYPANLQAEIDAVNDPIYNHVNNGVYKCGFATTQEAYEEAFANLFQALDELEDRLSRNRYLLGDRITEADWRLFTTLIRFDPVYVGHFKTNKHRLVDYPNLWAYTRELYQWPGVTDTLHFGHIKRHYFASHLTINPTGIVPLGPDLDHAEPHGRERLAAA